MTLSYMQYGKNTLKHRGKYLPVLRRHPHLRISPTTEIHIEKSYCTHPNNSSELNLTQNSSKAQTSKVVVV